MQDNWTEKLSDYIDGELTSPERERLESHLESCADCSSLLIELRRVVQRADDLPVAEPVTDLWPGIADRISSGANDSTVLPLRRFNRRIEFSLPQLAAAAVALMIVSGGITAGLGGGGSADPVIISPVAETGNVTLAAAEENQYETAIAEMEQALELGRSHLDEETLRILRENLESIDAAIREARRALAVDPASSYLNSYLARTMRRKLNILERGNNLVAAASL